MKKNNWNDSFRDRYASSPLLESVIKCLVKECNLEILFSDIISSRGCKVSLSLKDVKLKALKALDSITLKYCRFAFPAFVSLARHLKNFCAVHCLQQTRDMERWISLSSFNLPKTCLFGMVNNTKSTSSSSSFVQHSHRARRGKWNKFEIGK